MLFPPMPVISSNITHVAFTLTPPEANIPNPQENSNGAVAIGQGSTLEEARKRALENARQDALKKGISTEPVVSGESFEGGRYLGILQYPDSSRPNVTTAEPLEDIKPKKIEKPSWIIVIPLEQDGGKTTWNKNSTWTQSWIAPTRINGTRLVSTRGDADDHDKLTNDALASPGEAGSQANYIARKYGAPAVAFVRVDRNGYLEAWLWRNGSVVDTTGSGDTNIASLKKESLDMLSSFLNSNPDVTTNTKDVAETLPKPEPEPKVIPSFFLSEKTQKNSSWSIVLLCDTTDQLEQNEAKRVTRNIPGLDIVSYKVNEDGLSISASWSGALDALHKAILRAGATLEE